MNPNPTTPMPLAAALTAQTQELCRGLEDGSATIYEQVTPVTADLLRWWFLEDFCLARRFNFHAGQKSAILNAIVAHEVLNAPNLQALYQAVTPDTLLEGGVFAEVVQSKHAHPKYCLKMATGTGKTWVLQALLVWQLLNANAAKSADAPDPRFTRNFLIVAPGLIVYDRLLDAFCGKTEGGKRDFESSDIKRYSELFIPENERETVFGFVRGNVCKKEEIGLKTTGNGLLAITNWHLLSEEEDEESEDADVDAPGVDLPPERVVSAVLPLTPGKATGNALDVLDRRYARGNVLDYLSGLTDLMVFNDEAHHIHEVKKEGETSEVEWQKSLSRIAASKGRRFVQVDFSATPYNDVGTGKNKRKVYFPHIVVDFDLKAAMRAGLVKALVLDKRKEIGALPLEFKAERDEEGNPTLSEGQRVMLSAGFTKLKKLEEEFAAIDSYRRPKLMVMCEDTKVTPLVADFFRHDCLLPDDDILLVDSGKKGELGAKDWEVLRERLFDIDRHATPRVIVSVLMLREGFDVNNICVIVPLRSTQAQILLEQTIGRGLRLMWREAEYADLKRENRERIQNRQEPNNLLDVLSIIEHPAFQTFYDDLRNDGLVGDTDESSDERNSTGDLISVPLHKNFADYDFAIPFILREAEEDFCHRLPESLTPFSQIPREELKNLLGKGDVFISQDLQAGTLFGDYRVDGAVMKVSGYNDYLSRLTRRIAQALSQPLPKGNKIAAHLANPYMQANLAELSGWLDDYIRETLFSGYFEPMEDENWRLLLLQPVIDHIIKVFAEALVRNEERPLAGVAEVIHRRLSEVNKWPMREQFSLPVTKCPYERLPYPARSGGLEKAFIEWAEQETDIQAFCKISETRHDFVHLRYIRENGLAASYSPDFLVRDKGKVYLVETKAQEQTNSPNVRRKQKAALNWCERINALPEQERENRSWHYVLLGERFFYDWRGKNGRFVDMLNLARIRPEAGRAEQRQLL
jgi:type III restriction enzyme